MSDQCKNPAPNLSIQWFLNQILCLLRGSITGTQAVTITTLSASGTVAAGATSVEFHPSSTFNGTIAGVTYLGSVWQVIGPITAAPGKTLGDIEVTLSAGTINVLKVV